jgi:hypothetical protein
VSEAMLAPMLFSTVLHALLLILVLTLPIFSGNDQGRFKVYAVELRSPSEALQERLSLGRQKSGGESASSVRHLKKPESSQPVLPREMKQQPPELAMQKRFSADSGPPLPPSPEKKAGRLSALSELKASSPVLPVPRARGDTAMKELIQDNAPGRRLGSLGKAHAALDGLRPRGKTHIRPMPPPLGSFSGADLPADAKPGGGELPLPESEPGFMPTPAEDVAAALSSYHQNARRTADESVRNDVVSEIGSPGKVKKGAPFGVEGGQGVDLAALKRSSRSGHDVLGPLGVKKSRKTLKRAAVGPPGGPGGLQKVSRLSRGGGDVLGELRNVPSAGRGLLPPPPGTPASGLATASGPALFGKALPGGAASGHSPPDMLQELFAGVGSLPGLASATGPAGPVAVEHSAGAPPLPPFVGQADLPELQKESFGLPVPAALLAKDIRVELLSGPAEMPRLAVQLLSRPYEKAGEKYLKSALKPVELDEKPQRTDGERVKRTFVVANAERGVYTFLIRNTGADTCSVAVAVVLYGSTKSERKKAFETVEIAPRSSFKVRFILPDALFWDDDSFSGSIEDSNSVTKFTYGGLLWREDKEGH